MEQVRLFVAIGLSFLVLFIWSIFFVNYEKPEQPNKIENITNSLIDNEEDASCLVMDTIKEDNGNSFGLRLPRDIIVNTPLYRITVSEKGALVKEFKLKKYKEDVGAEMPFKELVATGLPNGNVYTYFSKNTFGDVNNVIFKSDALMNNIDVVNDDITLNFVWTDASGNVLTKSFKFDPDSYLIGMEISIKNLTSLPIHDNIVMSVKGRIENKSSYSFNGPSLFIDNKLKQVKLKDIDEVEIYDGQIGWVSVEDHYFMSSIIPAEDINGRTRIVLGDGVVENQIVESFFQINPGDKKIFEYFLFIGPKSMEVLNNLGFNLDKVLYFGVFDFIAKPCLWFMNKIYGVIPNYGIAIILLTICIKAILWPLGSKGYKSMSEMKKLQPLMAKIREKYKTDKQKMNQELMALYKTYKVNPMGGCLPMLLQIPVFFALYKMLYQAIELRHAPFIFWINDLSSPDRLFNFGFSVPFMQPPYGIPVLTIIMGGTMLLQQKMSPPPGDPTQAKMMMFMPIVFTFIFINFSSGLVLYWLINNLLSVGQQYYVQKKTI